MKSQEVKYNTKPSYWLGSLSSLGCLSSSYNLIENREALEVSFKSWVSCKLVGKFWSFEPHFSCKAT